MCDRVYKNVSRIHQVVEMESRLGLPGAGRAENWKGSPHGGGVSFWADENVLEVVGGDGCTALRMFQISPIFATFYVMHILLKNKRNSDPLTHCT